MNAEREKRYGQYQRSECHLLPFSKCIRISFCPHCLSERRSDHQPRFRGASRNCWSACERNLTFLNLLHFMSHQSTNYFSPNIALFKTARKMARGKKMASEWKKSINYWLSVMSTIWSEWSNLIITCTPLSLNDFPLPYSNTFFRFFCGQYAALEKIYQMRLCTKKNSTNITRLKF